MIVFYLNSRLIIFSVRLQKLQNALLQNTLQYFVGNFFIVHICKVLWNCFKNCFVLLEREMYVTKFCKKLQIKEIFLKNKSFNYYNANVLARPYRVNLYFASLCFHIPPGENTMKLIFFLLLPKFKSLGRKCSWFYVLCI